ncbi:Emp24/gp25L/p24 family/GOLD family protein isoform 2 [Hibiscus syriacus]|uniref:Emp24/gp25L/p24 family/GOLD family protein isoform 2 n=1 Tax=Hibiscus syriacus TaxID=106335 RepID=A0A6A2Z1Z8_HIBSY|nr:Emp24/gp25L/p24 family/GOLD family protein isoform 2 [Hibiscus syriacus]
MFLFRRDDGKRSEIAWVAMGFFLWSLNVAEGVRFVIDREECLSHDVKYEGDTVHVSYVVIKSDAPWNFNNEGVDLVITGPSGDQIHDFRNRVSEKYEFVVHKKGVYRFCFSNKSPYHETIDFDIKVGHFTSPYTPGNLVGRHALPPAPRVIPLALGCPRIARSDSLGRMASDAQCVDVHGTCNLSHSSQGIHDDIVGFDLNVTISTFLNVICCAVNDNMGRRALHKAMLESVALVAASILQIFLLKRMFERKLGTSRV